MSLRIGSNISSLAAQRHLDDATTAVSKSFQRLSSGLRINSASDDSAGLAISSSLKADSKIFVQAIRNINDGISAFNISEGALTELVNITTRQKELAEQAANGTYSLTQRRALNSEANALTNEFNRIVQTTSFNGVQLLSSSTNSLSLQAGSGTINTLSFAIAEELERTTGSGTFAARVSYGNVGSSVFLADFNRDGKLDLLVGASGDNTANIFLGNGDGTFKVRTSFAAGATVYQAVSQDFNGDGYLDIATADQGSNSTSVLLGNGDGSFKVRTSFITGSAPYSVAVSDFNNDGKHDLITADRTSNWASVFLGNGDGSFKARVTYATGTAPQNVITSDFNNDGFIDVTTADGGTSNVSVLLGNGNGSFRAKVSLGTGANPFGLVTDDFNLDGIADLAVSERTTSSIGIFFGNGDGSFSARLSFGTGLDPRSMDSGDLNGDGIRDLITGDNTGGTISILLGNGNGTFKASTSYAVSGNANQVEAVDVNGDGILDIASAEAGNISILMGNSTEVTTIGLLNLLSQAEARAALVTLDSQLDRVTKELGSIGSTQSRLGVTINHLQSTRENYESAYSRIMDADIAEESSKLIRNQILQQSGIATLAQANQQPALVLRLLSA